MILVLFINPSLAFHHSNVWIEIENIPKENYGKIENLGFVIDGIQSDKIIAYGDSNKIELLNRNNFIARIIPQDSELGIRLYPANLDGYHSYSELRTVLKNYSDTYPSLCQFDSIGTTVEGRWLWMVRITSNVIETGYKPQFRYISTMHGDEPVGTELLVYLIDTLLTSYSSDSDIRSIVDNTEMFIIPMMNPDGNSATPYPTRYNANGKDLNRNYPVPDGSIGSDGTFIIEPENRIVMDFSLTKNFILSANFHTGATVVNYLWDYTPVMADDDSLLRLIALNYTSTNPNMLNSTSFDQGIVQGYFWYPVYGSLQDWSYDNRCMDFTIELNDTKWPNASLLSGIWDNNNESMLNFIRWANVGIYGVVNDSLTGEPVFATIQPSEGASIKTDSLTGFYHKIKYPGTFTVNYSAGGYESKDILVSLTGNSVERNVQLVPYLPFILEGNVNLITAGNDSGATITITQGDYTFTSTTNILGDFIFDDVTIGGMWTIRFSAPDFADTSFSVYIDSGDTLNFAIELRPKVSLYRVDFEENAGGISSTDGTLWEWGEPTGGPGYAYSGEKCCGTNLSYAYSNSTFARIVTPEIGIPEWSNAKLTFYHWYDFEYSESRGRYYDGGNVKLSADGGPFGIIYPDNDYPITIWTSNTFLIDQPAYGGYNHQWTFTQFDLTDYAGQNVVVSFDFGSDANTVRYGWYIDDIEIWTPDYTVDIKELRIPNEFSLFDIYPNPCNESVRINTDLDKFDLQILNIQGAIVYREKDRKLIELKGLPSGLYFIRLSLEDIYQTKSLILLK